MRHSSFALASGLVTSLIVSLSGAALAQDASPAPATPTPGATPSGGAHHHHHKGVCHKHACGKKHRHHHGVSKATTPSASTAPAAPAAQ